MAPFAPRRILAATDFSDCSTGALRHAAMWARRYDAELIVLHAQEFPPAGEDPYFGSYGPAGMMQSMREQILPRFRQYVREHVPPEILVSRALAAGTPASAIEECARSKGVDLVVLGTHGRGGIQRFLLGSVAERALRMAQHPTLIVRQPVSSGVGALADSLAGGTSSGREGSGPEVPCLRHILCPVNYTEVARAAFEHAYGVAQTFGARLTVVFAVEPEDDYLSPKTLKDAEDKLWYWLPAKAAAECQLQPVIQRGNAAEQVVTLARQAEVDLIVIGAQHRRFCDDAVLGVTTVRVTRHAPCPVLVVPRSDEK